MSQFQIGDRVVYGPNDIYVNAYPWLRGATGTVCRTSHVIQGRVGVQWDKTIASLTNDQQTGHSCSGQCPAGYGWNVYEKYLGLIEESMPEDVADVNVEEVL